jgi:hypothetical protein
MTALFHVGCGRALFTLEQLREASTSGGMAMACATCGAGSPIVVRDLNELEINSPGLPASLARRMSQAIYEKNLPHLEFYLGYRTTFRCLAKEAWALFLRGLGSVSQEECDEPKCREQYPRQVERYNRQEAAEPC